MSESDTPFSTQARGEVHHIPQVGFEFKKVLSAGLKRRCIAVLGKPGPERDADDASPSALKKVSQLDN